MRRLACFLFTVLLSTITNGCVRQETVPYAYRLPLEDNSHGPETARACAANCNGLYGPDSPAFYACLQTCPDARVSEGVACTDDDVDKPPRSYCFTRLVAERKADPEVAGAALGIIAKLAELGVALALSDHEHHEHHGRHEHRHRH